MDVDHPDLKTRIWRNRDSSASDRHGRDFFLPDTDPDHFNPRPKKFQSPFHETSRNDIHGTACAGVAAAAGNVAFGASRGASGFFPSRSSSASELAADEPLLTRSRIRLHIADVISCSWYGPRSPDVALALQDVGRIGRDGLGTAVFCATGNTTETGEFAPPPRSPDSIAVGASTDEGKLASYSNVGPEVDLVAPSSGGRRASSRRTCRTPAAGTTPGDPSRGGADGLYWQRLRRIVGRRSRPA